MKSAKALFFIVKDANMPSSFLLSNEGGTEIGRPRKRPMENYRPKK